MEALREASLNFDQVEFIYGANQKYPSLMIILVENSFIFNTFGVPYRAFQESHALLA